MWKRNGKKKSGGILPTVREVGNGGNFDTQGEPAISGNFGSYGGGEQSFRTSGD